MRSRINPELAKTLNISTIRQYSRIRYDKKLNKEIDDTLRRYNNKIKRLARQQSNYILPQQVTKEDLMEVAYTRQDLQRRLNNLKKFNERGAEETIYTKSGYALSKYELNYLKREKARVKRSILKDIKYYEEKKPKLYGKEMSTTFARMGDTNYLNLLTRYKEINVDVSNLSLDELFEYRKMLYNVGKDRNYLAENFKLNYIDMITDLAYYANYDKKKLNKLKAKLATVDASKFYDLYINEKSIKEATNYYYTKFKALKDVEAQKITELYDDILDNINDILKDYT